MSKYWQKYDLDIANDSRLIYETPSYETIKNLPYLQEYGFFSAKDTYYTERQKLRSYLILLTVNGSGSLFYQNKEYILQPTPFFLLIVSNINFTNQSKIGSFILSISMVLRCATTLRHFFLIIRQQST